MRRATPLIEPAEVVDIGAADCFQLLRRHSVGRIAVALPGEAPFVVPVNYVLDDEVIVFRSGFGEKLRRLRQEPVSFQIDHIDPFRRCGWSVLVEGVAYEATPDEIGHLDTDGPQPWAPGARDIWVRLVPRRVSGRCIVPASASLEPHAYL
jgi:hypothetical protein